ncbi:MAG: 16S rRNA (guanine(527)-N(7))-methyltransferase RsmG [Cohaesibacteraceae bacterium]|nr:16S rRNA (guanine(527)-N(7))-methyltransferase RsmG [Cohaesibacteraceae bacterium]MBL4877066.1 16S rRNA (guanine(527)-N(7))-methyltransferase RsmG [Cohaesibacteraceae bacterium]
MCRELNVSRETISIFECYIELLKKWQKVQNLVSNNTLHEVWDRHIADSMQTVLLYPDAKVWMDLGSGGGLPGIVLAILLKNNTESHVHMIESNLRKVAFLRTVIRELSLKATVHSDRADKVISDWKIRPDAISARGFAAFSLICDLCEPLISKGSVGVFHKGKDFIQEFDKASLYWSLDLIQETSMIDKEGVMIILKGLTPRPTV